MIFGGETITIEPDFTEAEKLLAEWFNQWYERDEMPTKMDNSLHVRTGMYFILRTHGG